MSHRPRKSSKPQGHPHRVWFLCWQHPEKTMPCYGISGIRTSPRFARAGVPSPAAPWSLLEMAVVEVWLVSMALIPIDVNNSLCCMLSLLDWVLICWEWQCRMDHKDRMAATTMTTTMSPKYPRGSKVHNNWTTLRNAVSLLANAADAHGGVAASHTQIKHLVIKVFLQVKGVLLGEDEAASWTSHRLNEVFLQVREGHDDGEVCPIRRGHIRLEM